MNGVVGMVIVLIVITIVALVSRDEQIRRLNKLEASMQQLIEECEKSLPRDKTCKLVAVEESE